MARLVIISNRLPVNVSKKGDSLRFQASVGGLATGVGSLVKTHEVEWIGWPGIALEKIDGQKKKDICKHLHSKGYSPVFLSQAEIDNYYSGFCNNTLWPLFHYFTQHTVYKKKFWTSYKKVNEIFCEAALKVIKPGDVVWIHDYHLMLLPQLLREKIPDITLGFFLHIPFPSYEVFRLLPWRKEILEGLLGADLIGFHTYDYARHLLSSLRNRFGYENSFGRVFIDDRTIKVDSFPMGINYDQFSNSGLTPAVKKEIKKNQKKVGSRRLILSIDRLDYTKGILQRLFSYDNFLDKYPEYKEKVVLILVAVPSRTKVENYRQLKKELDEMVGRISGKHGTIGWSPVWYMYKSLGFNVLTSLYNMSDVALVTPLRDGMNLIAKEFLATKTEGTGVLILSEMAGASKELSEAIIVNPNNMERVSDSIYKALTMPLEEQIQRNRTMQKRLKRYDIEKWADDFINSLLKIKENERDLLVNKITDKTIDKIAKDFHKCRRRIIVLDYDGTLMPFKTNPQDVKPDNEILEILSQLSNNTHNEVLIVSGRDKNFLNKHFKDIHIGLVAEHGVWIKKKFGIWTLVEPLSNYWKDDIKSILESYVDKTPGSFIEEKDYSLAWHYRKSDPELASNRARELKEAIFYFSTNLGLGVLEGNKVIEIKNAGINKGHAALKWVADEYYDFILAAGDDRTDEDIFNVLPEHAYSIKVGAGPSKAKYSIDSITKLRRLLKKLIM